MMQSIKAFVIASPGNSKDKFAKYLRDMAEKKRIQWLNDLSSKAIIAGCSSGYLHSLKEVLAD